MASAPNDAVLSKIIKLLALAEGGESEQESLRAMEQVHRMLAEHNLSLDEIKAREQIAPALGRKVDETQFDASVDRWTVAVWHASADLFFCSYFYREEGDRSQGQWRCSRLRHCVVGSEANKVTTKVMADHFCRVIRRLARQHAHRYGGGLVTRRSFAQGCADRLVERMRAQKIATSRAPTAGTTLPALLGLYDSERMANEAALAAQGITLRFGRGRTPKKAGDVLAEHYGRAAAENISLALQIGADPGSADTKPARKPVSSGSSQIDFAF